MLKPKNTNSTFFPKDIIENISMFLEVRHFPQIMQLNKHFYNALNSNTFWCQVNYRDHHSKDFEKYDTGKKYYAEYHKYYNKSKHLPEKLKTFLAENSLSYNFSKDGKQNKRFIKNLIAGCESIFQYNPNSVSTPLQKLINDLKKNIDHSIKFLFSIARLYMILPPDVSEQLHNDYLKFIVYEPFSFDVTYDKEHDKVQIVIEIDDLLIDNSHKTFILPFKNGKYIKKGLVKSPCKFDFYKTTTLNTYGTEKVVDIIIRIINEEYLQPTKYLRLPHLNKNPWMPKPYI